MIRFAAKGTAFEALEPNLEGPTALAVSKTDATAPARILAEFAKTAPALEIKGGVVEGVYYDEKGMAQISSIPSREVLLGKLLGSIQSPITKDVYKRQVFDPVNLSEQTVMPLNYMYELVFGASNAVQAVRDSGVGAAIGVMMAVIVVAVFSLTTLIIKNDDADL